MSDNQCNWNRPLAITDVEFAFPVKVIGKLIPDWDHLPQQFRDFTSGYELLARHACFNSVELKPEALRPGIGATQATRHLSAVARSFEPKHEHKEAGLAFLLSLWLQPAQAENTTATGEHHD